MIVIVSVFLGWLLATIAHSAGWRQGYERGRVDVLERLRQIAGLAKVADAVQAEIAGEEDHHGIKLHR